MELWAFTILTFGSVALLVLAVAAALVSPPGENRRRLKQRLSLTAPATTQLQEQSLLLVQQQSRGALHELLGRYELFRRLRSALKQSMPDITVERFLGITACGIVAGALLGFLVSASLIPSLIGAMIGAYVPFVVVVKKKMRRQKLLAEQLPDGLDFLGRSLRAGHSLPIGLQMMGVEMPAPLSEEFGRCYDEISLGHSPEEALKGMIERVESTDFAFFVTAVLVQRQTGGDLAQVLDNITGMLRQRIQLQQQVKAKTAEGRFTGYILAAFPMVMFLLLFVMNQRYAELLINTTIGKMMLGSSLVLSMIGLYVIKKITTVTI